MSISSMPTESQLMTADEFKQLTSEAKVTIPEDEFDDFRILTSAIDSVAQQCMQSEDYIPHVDLAKYPRSGVHVPKPADSDMGGWACKATVKAATPTSDLLKGRTLAIKDNIAVAGLPCNNGSTSFPWVPTVDATVVTRLLDAGATVTGKAANENNCFGAISDSSVTGRIHNPHATGYSCGGSSSGSARLVGSGAVDMAIGADQGGSIRVPAANCGLVGLKATWGLIPYTGCLSLEATIDHVGPMTANVTDCALLMDVIAGTDGIDDRNLVVKPGDIKFVEGIKKTLSAPAGEELKGVRIGILKEGFAHPITDPRVEKLVREAAESLRKYGATVSEVSIPSHITAPDVHMLSLPLGVLRQNFRADLTGRKGLYMTDRVVGTTRPLSQAAFDGMGASAQNLYLRGLFLEKKYGPELHARAANLTRKHTDDYNRALEQFDVLVMPTQIALSPKIMEEGTMLPPLKRLSRTVGLTVNTSAFNFTGHPGLTIPIGMSSPRDDVKVRLPVGLQLIGGHYEDLLLLQIAAAWERDNDWKEKYVA